jgi:alkylation response protein AidB-like acyl-CoA dehydrogenase
MNFELDEEQVQLADSLARLLGDHYTFEQRRAIAATDIGFSPAVWTQLAALGVAGLGIPNDYGGLGGGAVERLPVFTAAGRALLLEPYLASVVLGATALREGGSQAQKERWLGAIAAGTARLAWAHDEPGGRHEPLWVETRAQQTDGRWHLTGAKLNVLHAAGADRIVVSARLAGGASDEAGVALFLLDPGTAGASLRTYRLVDDTPAARLDLAQAEAEPLCVEPGLAARAVRSAIDAGCAAACADMLGAMEAAMELTRSYLVTRKQFGRAIGEYQVLRHAVADMQVGLELARSMAVAAAVAADDPAAPAARADLMRAKLVIGRHARALCHAAIQMHGGIGMTEEYAVGHYLRRVHVMDQLFGDAAAQAQRLAALDVCEPAHA